MSQPATTLDVPSGETIRLGSQVITFTAAGNLVAEDIQFTKGMRGRDFPNTLGQDTKAAYSSLKGVGTMTVQLKTVSSTVQHGDSGNVVLSNGTTMPFFVTAVSEVYQQSGAAKIQVTFAEWMQFSPIPKLLLYDGPVGNEMAISPYKVKAHNVAGSNQQAFVVSQRFAILATSFASSGLGALGPVIEGQQTYLVDEGETEDVGVGGMIEREVTWASKPTAWDMPVSVPKNYQLAQYVINGSGQTIDISIAGYTQVVKAIQHHEYILDPGGSGFALPKVPSIAIIKFLTNSIQITDFGSGFPTDVNGRYTSNQGTSFITGGIEPYLGKMYVVKTVYG